ncbi:hypothetical protein FXO38_00980 [Capsicum annuum]|nr:hypothetical protein FXO38_00980 [Capsicum annuum]
MKKLRHVEINYAELDLEDDKQGIFEESSKMENLRILRGVKYHGDRLNVLLRRCPNLHELEISSQDNIYDTCISLKLESLTQLHLSFTHAAFLSGLHLPSNLKKLDSAEKIKKEVKEDEGYDRINLITIKKMAQNDIDSALDQLRRIKSRGDLSSVKIDQIETLEMELRFLRTLMKYNNVVLPNARVKITKMAKLIVEMLHSVFVGIPDEYKTKLNLERQSSPHELAFEVELGQGPFLDMVSEPGHPRFGLPVHAPVPVGPGREGMLEWVEVQHWLSQPEPGPWP